MRGWFDFAGYVFDVGRVLYDRQTSVMPTSLHIKVFAFSPKICLHTLCITPPLEPILLVTRFAKPQSSTSLTKSSYLMHPCLMSLLNLILVHNPKRDFDSHFSSSRLIVHRYPLFVVPPSRRSTQAVNFCNTMCRHLAIFKFMRQRVRRQ